MVAFAKSTIVGYPRIGANRELKKAQEAYWAGRINLDELKSTASLLRINTYAKLRELGLTEDFSIPATFSYYDQMLDVTTAFGAIPERFEWMRHTNENAYSTVGVDGQRELNSFGERMRRPSGIDELDLDTYFAIARGQLAPDAHINHKNSDAERKIYAAEMTKWFDTNYHYIVPELTNSTRLSLSNYELVRQFEEAKSAGFLVRPVLIGPITFLALSKYQGVHFKQLVNDLIACYARIMNQLAISGAEWIQLDEPALISQMHGLEPEDIEYIANKCYLEFANISPKRHERPNILVSTPLGKLDDHFELAANLPVEALHVDSSVVDRYSESELKQLGSGRTLVLGIVNGRNIWRADLGKMQEVVSTARSAVESVGGSLSISTSCSLQHVPHSLDYEKKLKHTFPELISNLSFADEKIGEVVALSNGYYDVERPTQKVLNGRNLEEITSRLAKIGEDNLRRESIQERKDAQRAKLNLPLLPTTTIGSFPQTQEIRKIRALFKKGEVTSIDYEQAMKKEIADVIQLQEKIGLDVLVHGEAERNDMVQYFAENFEGFSVTENGWVQSYGSRCTKPSILWGDVYRERAFTVPWITYAQSLTDKPVKGMLTGPVTILAWSFVRDDIPRSEVANQIALALQDEILDLEHAGISIIQVDEPALRELLPLKKAEQADYLRWSVNSFLLATSCVKKHTQIHTHLCYSEFEVILPAIIGLNADVTSIEAARSKMEIVKQLASAKYPLGIGPGVYDIHSPRIPDREEVVQLLKSAVDEFKAENLQLENLWVNPDCGLKTRKEAESTQSLENMVQATQIVRIQI
ncbi:MAG: 5-methyltetrahydropteroyltriglutamate--homocysteine S-methyltransferase [Candidatus Ancillula sp.]|jgi:5-methyltetrahydropteroyltriglutamate--homocysteine methyltransferase|nr:5-methyltetrahydropteroyltriglutamate--homocysteine S-methyltransferase [Candidatus Ancillula sp.]